MRVLVSVVFLCATFYGGVSSAQKLAVDVSHLPADQKVAFNKLLAEEVCPCDCPKSFGQCLVEGTKCQPAVLLAEWVLSSYEAGVPPDAVAEALAKEITGGFNAAQKAPALAGFATKGAQKPTYTIVEYADFECGSCRAAAPVLEAFVKKRSDVQVVFKHFPLSFHPMARKAAIAAEAAARQNKFWPMHDALFATQDVLSDALITGHAKALGLDVARFERDLADPAIHKKVDDSRNEGATLGVAATPALYVNGRPYFLHRTIDALELRLKMEQARATSTCQ